MRNKTNSSSDRLHDLSYDKYIEEYESKHGRLAKQKTMTEYEDDDCFIDHRTMDKGQPCSKCGYVWGIG